MKNTENLKAKSALLEKLFHIAGTQNCIKYLCYGENRKKTKQVSQRNYL